MDLVWQHAPGSRLSPSNAFTLSVETWQLNVRLDDPAYGVLINPETLSLSRIPHPDGIACPRCHHNVFHTMEGRWKGRAALGLRCAACHTYGAVFPDGL